MASVEATRLSVKMVTTNRIKFTVCRGKMNSKPEIVNAVILKHPFLHRYVKAKVTKPEEAEAGIVRLCSLADSLGMTYEDSLPRMRCQLRLG